MSKYITHFQTEAAYQAALPSLDLPNVSLVDELGEVHYHRALYGAHAGDIALYDVAEGQKIIVTAEDWNLTTYPTASYPIIGVVVADELVDGVHVVGAFNLNTDGTPTTSNQSITWQSEGFDWGLTKYTTEETAITDTDGKTNTSAIIAAIKAYDLEHSTDNITGHIGKIESFYVTGTNVGDWYIPSYGELNAFINTQAVTDTITAIRTVDTSLFNDIAMDAYASSTEYYETQSNYIEYGSYTHRNKNYICLARPFYKLT